MDSVRLAIVYYSTYGTNYAMAKAAQEAAEKMGAQVRLLKVAETAPEQVVANTPAWKAQADKTADMPVASAEDMQWANAYLFSAPTRFGVMASQMRAFIDTLGGIWAKGELANKAASAMSSAQNMHGGQEATLLSMYATFMHWGSIIVPPGYTDPVIFASGGNPYGASATANGEPLSDALKDSIRHQTQRLVTYAAKIAS
ncbi:NAD(P)H:quinone oxidoreductase [Orrella sp. 11846]|uniref:NAD(P)H:quinone oxidoreductase n=1 Tax=Orrella sp. 11846 TaxID=3409913 RepID=UPI003B5B241E